MIFNMVSAVRGENVGGIPSPWKQNYKYDKYP